jgi:hypothetical protein
MRYSPRHARDPRRARSTQWSALMVTTPDQVAAKAGSQIGRSVPRLEGRDKVTGRAEYTHTMRIPGMRHAKIFRSTVAHGRITSIDTSAAIREEVTEPQYKPSDAARSPQLCQGIALSVHI